jgi:hypothetical protein
MASPKKGKDSSPAEATNVGGLTAVPLPGGVGPKKGKDSSPAEAFNPGGKIQSKRSSWKPERGTPASFGPT